MEYKPVASFNRNAISQHTMSHESGAITIQQNPLSREFSDTEN